MELIRYILGTRKHAEMRKILLPQGGLAIERRRKRLAKFWNPHLSRCKSIQKDWCQNLENENLTILGAGRLYDVNRESLLEVSQSISLFDGDPLCLPIWQRFLSENNKHQISFHMGDVTNTLLSWKNQLDADLEKSKDFYDGLTALQHIGTNELPSSSFLDIESTSIISLNILSQLPIVWQQICEKSFCKSFGNKTFKNNEDAWLEALIPSGRKLVDQHLRDLNQSRAKNILLLTDTEYVLVHPDKQEVVNALFGLDLNSTDKLKEYFPSYSVEERDKWEWEIAPLGSESKSFGSTHKISCFSLALEF